ncbi:MAG: SufD family Fe-S cluster assembly protein, partial [Bdellovibrionales bacterium]|nr:SufD family Fe-S cluster assembly protein [Bdellovibrionales bacterium]
NFVDHHTWIDHQVEHTTSSQEYHGVVTGKARAVFNGKIKIHKDAQKSSTSQINKNLLLSSTAEVDTKPELMIYADDVKASHGATIGQIQKDELFYLLSRGLTASQAKELLCAGFLNSIGESLSENLQEEFRLSVKRSLAKIVEG